MVQRRRSTAFEFRLTQPPRALAFEVVEDAVRGQPRNAATGEMAGKLAVRGAIPLQFNAYKIR